MSGGKTAARVGTERNLVRKYPVTGGWHQQVPQLCTEMVPDPLVKYLFRVSGNLRTQVTGLDKAICQEFSQICCLRFYSLRTQDSQQTQITNQFSSVLKCTFQMLDSLGFLSVQLAELSDSRQDSRTGKPTSQA